MDDTRLGFDNSYKRLPDRFYVAIPPEPVVAPRLIAFNRPLAQALGLAHLEANAADIFSGNAVPAGAEPLWVPGEAGFATGEVGTGLLGPGWWSPDAHGV